MKFSTLQRGTLFIETLVFVALLPSYPVAACAGAIFAWVPFVVGWTIKPPATEDRLDRTRVLQWAATLGLITGFFVSTGLVLVAFATVTGPAVAGLVALGIIRPRRSDIVFVFALGVVALVSFTFLLDVLLDGVGDAWPPATVFAAAVIGLVIFSSRARRTNRPSDEANGS
jgi:hypothetical protein